MTEVATPIWYAFFPLASHCCFAVRPTKSLVGLVQARARRRAIALKVVTAIHRRAFGYDPVEPQLCMAPSGKPYLSTAIGIINISLSYTDKWALVALSGDEVGCDIEASAVGADWARRVNALAGRDLIVTPRDPLASWVRVEAAIKLMGGSISNDLSRIWMEPRPRTHWEGGFWPHVSPTFWTRNIPAPDISRAAIAAREEKSLIHVPLEGQYADMSPD